jgi:hypothetical protein
MFDNTGLGVSTPGDAKVYGSGFDPIISTSGSVTESQVSAFSADWNGVDIGARWSNTYARTTATESTTPSGALYVCNRSDGIRSFHGKAILPIFSRVLTDADYEVLRPEFEA